MGGTIELDIYCDCGKPQWDSAHGASGHAFRPRRAPDQMRDDQKAVQGARPGHYALKSYQPILVVAPLVGVDVVAKVPPNTRWRVVSLSATLTTSAVAANRVPHLQVTDGQGNITYDFPASGNQVTGLTYRYSAAAESVQAFFDSAQVMVLPSGLKLLQNWTVGFKTTALDGGDQWSALALHVKVSLDF